MAFAQNPHDFLERGRSPTTWVTGALSEKAGRRGREPARASERRVHVAATTEKDKSYARVRVRRTLAHRRACIVTVQARAHPRFGTRSTRPWPFPKANGVVAICRATSCRSRRRVSVLSHLCGARRRTWTERRHHVCIKKELIARGRKDLRHLPVPHAAANPVRLYNTPPLRDLPRATLSWARVRGGVPRIEEATTKKAGFLMTPSRARAASTGCRGGSVASRCLSIMNACAPTHSRARGRFREAGPCAERTPGPERPRSVGGIRSSLSRRRYRLVETLASFIKDFAREGYRRERSDRRSS